ncbi:MAG: type A chloramphenicol O-acetyltransferase [Synergistaceae bacterium]|nr:type A chloramphenicol O-acetyltransferase [Synergistaceae bacterium]
MDFILVDIENWERKEHYDHYMHQVRCTYSMTVNVDITGLRCAIKKANKKIYPVLIYMLASVVNQYREFRMDTDTEGNLGYWDEVNPSYTVFNKSKEIFSNIWTMYNESFTLFYENCESDIAEFSNTAGIMPKVNEPPNTFNISCLPWTNFTAFNLNIFADGSYLPPIFTIGRFMEENNKTVMPLALQVHHSVCDGFHAGRFISTFTERADSYEKWLYN